MLQQPLDFALVFVPERFVVWLWRIARQRFTNGVVFHRQPQESLAPEPVDAIVRRNREQPRREFLIDVIGLELRVRAQKGFLRGIFRVIGIAQHSIRQIIDRRLIVLDQFGECILVAASCAGHEQLLFQRFPLAKIYVEV